ncbi:hypothetical protein [Streptomyces sp. RM72]|uniref:ATP-dependent DNA ligase n=1 Tax=Streptomyces sp. RM72 TaxID=1115510 RepID=UPI0027E2C8A2|nr:hypothetical protein [Streptomyces sp. RM72]
MVWEGERLTFERLHQRMARRRGAGAIAAARTWPAHLVVFDVLHQDGTDLTPWPYARRRTALETLFADTPLNAPFTLCSLTTDPATARDWLTWTSAGLEGLCFKRLSEPYRAGPGRRANTRYAPPPGPSSVPSPDPRPRPARSCSAATTTQGGAVHRPPAPSRSPAPWQPASRPRWRRPSACIRGREGRSPPGGAAATSWTLCSSTRSWWWKSPWTSPVTPPAGGVILSACVAHVPTCLHHAGGHGDAGVAGELGDEGFRGGAGRGQDVGDGCRTVG